MINDISYSDADLKAAAIRAVLFFDLFDYPLTALEIWRYLEIKIDLARLMTILNQGIDGLECSSGFYYRLGREKIILERLKRYNVSRSKFKRAKRNINLLKLLPGIKFVGVANLIGAHNWRSGSDIDLLIISSPGRIWTSRFFAAGLMKLLGRRPQGVNKADKICLSFYASTDALDFNELRLKPFDPYFTYWLADLHPVYGHNLYAKLIADNSWLSQVLPNWRVDVKLVTKVDYYRQPNSFERLIERLLKRWQLRLMPLALRQPQANSGVVVNDKILKLYVIDKRPEIAAKFQTNYENFGPIN